MGAGSAADAGFTPPRSTLDEAIAKLTTFQDAVGSGAIQFTGNPMRLGELMALMDEFPRMFETVEPKWEAVRRICDPHDGRSRRSNPAFSVSGKPSYFAALAMTVLRHGSPSYYSALLTSLIRGSAASIRLL